MGEEEYLVFEVLKGLRRIISVFFGIRWVREGVDEYDYFFL